MQPRSLMLLLVITVSVYACQGDDGSVVLPPPSYAQTFGEEFDGAAGQSPDPAIWRADVGGDGWGNEQLEYNTDRVSNASLDGEGHLQIVARRETFGANTFTSARLTTAGLYTTLYGRVEARIKLPTGRGIWPAFWMLGDSYNEVGWPQTGEIDIMEFRGQEPQVVLGSLHGPGYSGGDALTKSYRKAEGTFGDDFHVFMVEWDPSRITFSVAGEVYSVVTSTTVLDRGDWVYNHPFFIILNVAVGGNFVGSPDASTPFPATMLVDYVRVYERL